MSCFYGLCLEIDASVMNPVVVVVLRLCLTRQGRSITVTLHGDARVVDLRSRVAHILAEMHAFSSDFRFKYNAVFMKNSAYLQVGSC